MKCVDCGKDAVGIIEDTNKGFFRYLAYCEKCYDENSKTDYDECSLCGHCRSSHNDTGCCVSRDFFDKFKKCNCKKFIEDE